MAESVIRIRPINLPGYSPDDIIAALQRENLDIEYYKFVYKPGVIYANSAVWQIISDAEPLVSLLSFLLSVYSAVKDKPKSDPPTQIIINVENGGSVGKIVIDEQTKTIEDLTRQLQQTQSDFDAFRREIGHPASAVDQASALRNSPNWKRTK